MCLINISALLSKWKMLHIAVCFLSLPMKVVTYIQYEWSLYILLKHTHTQTKNQLGYSEFLNQLNGVRYIISSLEHPSLQLDKMLILIRPPPLSNTLLFCFSLSLSLIVTCCGTTSPLHCHRRYVALSRTSRPLPMFATVHKARVFMISAICKSREVLLLTAKVS